jgi:hypothetical protein
MALGGVMMMILCGRPGYGSRFVSQPAFLDEVAAGADAAPVGEGR